MAITTFFIKIYKGIKTDNEIVSFGEPDDPENAQSPADSLDQRTIFRFLRTDRSRRADYDWKMTES